MLIPHKRALCIALIQALVPLLLTASSGKAQERGGLPDMLPLNPMAQSRTGLYFQPFLSPASGWKASVALDHGSAIEYNIGSAGEYLLDAELTSFNLSLRRDLGSRYFVVAGASLGTASPGFMDPFLNWYHDLLGFKMPERDLRPNDRFAYQIALPGGRSITAGWGTRLNDIRFTGGRRHNRWLQTVLTTTLPTGGGGDRYARGTVSVSAITTVRTPLSGRLLYEGSIGVGFSPSHGTLADFQNETFVLLTSGLRYRILGRQSLYLNVLRHSPYYEGTGYAALDREDLSLSYGWILSTAGGTEWKIGMVEDLAPTGPAIDAIFQFGVTW